MGVGYRLFSRDRKVETTIFLDFLPGITPFAEFGYSWAVRVDRKQL